MSIVRRRAATAPRGVFALAASLLVLTTIGAAVAPAPRAARAAPAAAPTTALNLRAGPSTWDWILLVMPAGSGVTVTGDPQNGFYPVSYGNAWGWAYGDYLAWGDWSAAPAASSAPSAAATGTATTTTALNLRAGPSLADGILAVMPYGSSVTLTGNNANGFAAVAYNGVAGWAYASYLGRGAPAPAPAAPAPAPAAPAPAASANVAVAGASEPAWIVQIIYDAAYRYGQSGEDMLRVARCESGLYQYAEGRLGELGIFQFMPSTWATTPYAGYDIFDPWANANAAGWMWQNGRRAEWVCQ